MLDKIEHAEITRLLNTSNKLIEDHFEKALHATDSVIVSERFDVAAALLAAAQAASKHFEHLPGIASNIEHTRQRLKTAKANFEKRRQEEYERQAKLKKAEQDRLAAQKRIERERELREEKRIEQERRLREERARQDRVRIQRQEEEKRRQEEQERRRREEAQRRQRELEALRREQQRQAALRAEQLRQELLRQRKRLEDRQRRRQKIREDVHKTARRREHSRKNEWDFPPKQHPGHLTKPTAGGAALTVGATAFAAGAGMIMGPITSGLAATFAFGATGHVARWSCCNCEDKDSQCCRGRVEARPGDKVKVRDTDNEEWKVDIMNTRCQISGHQQWNQLVVIECGADCEIAVHVELGGLGLLPEDD
jgi:hypothetical protein